MPLCEQCGARFANWLTIEGRPRNLSHRRYCLDCSPFGLHNTRQLSGPRSSTALPPELNELRCSRCKQVKPIAEFYRRRDGYRPHAWCKACNLEHRKARFRADRYAALRHYAAGEEIKCACCGESRLEFLGLDHINNDGAEHRRSIAGNGRGSGTHFYTRLRLTGYTYRDLVVACFNCNMARAFSGKCPHQAM